MARITVENGLDFMGKPCVFLRKTRGKITLAEAYEALQKSNHWGPQFMQINVQDETPMDLYDEGDCWTLYEPGEMLSQSKEDVWGEGYEACMADYNIGKD